MIEFIPLARWKKAFFACLGCVLALGAGLRVAASASLEFGGARTIANDAGYWWAKVLGDIDGDGLLDVVVQDDNGHGGWLGWYETDDGAQSWTQHIVANTAPNGEQFACGDLDLGDFDGDGDLDLLGIAHTGEWDGNGATSTIYWYENDDLAWTPHLIGQTSGFIKDIDVADFNSDGRLDLACVLFNNHTLVIFRQDASNFWTKVQDFAITNLHEGMDVGDIDGDGDPDIAANGYWIESPGGDLTAAWTVRAIDSRWHSDPAGQNFRNNATKVYCQDITGDGRVEVFVSDSENAEPIMWYESADPKNGAWTGHEIAAGLQYVHTLQVFDLDLDGDFDVFTGENGDQLSGGQAIVYLNDGDNLNWTPRQIDTAGTYNSLAGDIEGDGDYDIWRLPGHAANFFELIPNTTDVSISLDSWTYIEVTDQHSRVFGLTFGDVNSDGLSDIISGQYAYLNPGDDMTGAWQRIALGGEDALFAVNVDDDALADVVAFNSTGLFWREANDAQGTSWTSTQVHNGFGADHNISSQGYSLGQIVPGGKEELIISTDDEAIYYAIPADPLAGDWPATIIATGTGGEGVDAGDVDRDDLTDVVGRSGGNVVWWKNPGTGAGSWAASTIGSTPNAADRIALADINGDDRLDLIVSEETGGTSGSGTWWFEQPADPADLWTRHEIAQQATTNSMEVADFDADGDPDVITGEHRGTEKVIIWENDGAGAFSPHEVDAGIESHLGVRPVDLDNDGDLDVVSIAWDDPEFIHLWRNDGGAGTVRISEVVDEGRACFKITTPTATYFFDKDGGGFTSILDKSGVDWIGWNTSNGSAGQYRGIPNTGELHPGYEGAVTTTNNALNTPLPKVMIETSRNGYAARWEFFPSYARMILHTVPKGGSYWILYEGNPGGAVDAADRLHLSNGRDYSANDDHPWNGDYAAPNNFEDIENTSGAATGAEWCFFAASEMERSFYAAHTDDSIEDDYWQMNDDMTVFGFGRTDSSSSLLTASNAQLVIGFVDSIDPAVVRPSIHAAWSGLIEPPRAATPEISPAGGTHVGGVSVTLTCATAGAEIRYTTDGSDPTGSSMLYVDSLIVTGDTQLKARAFRSGWLESGIAETSFTIVPDSQPPVIVSVTAGPNLVTVEFNEPVQAGPAETAGNYSIAPGVSVSAAELQSGQRTVALTVSELLESVNYTLSVEAVADLSGNITSSGTTALFVFEPADVTTGLVAHWRFDERESSEATDSSGDHDGTIQGPLNEAGQLGRALRFDGSNDYVNAGAWDVSGEALTICAWLRADRFDHLSYHDARILSKAVGIQEEDHYWMLSGIRDGSNTRLRFRLKADGSTKTLIASSGNLPANVWIHAAAVYDGSAMRLYMNGVEAGSVAQSGSLTAGPSVPVWIGGNPSGASDRPFDGLLDDVRIYARALTADEISYLATWKPLATFEDWGAHHGRPTSDLMLDSDQDGVPLINEFAFRLDPTIADAKHLSADLSAPGLPAGVLSNTTPARFAVEYLRRTHASDLIYTVELSSDLDSDWSNAFLSQTVIRLNSEWERVIVWDQLTLDGAGRRFGRVRVDYAP